MYGVVVVFSICGELVLISFHSNHLIVIVDETRNRRADVIIDDVILVARALDFRCSRHVAMIRFCSVATMVVVVVVVIIINDR